SYPLYLWHWPALLLFQRYTSFFEVAAFGRPAFKAVVLLGTTAASWLTFRFVEVPFRFGARRDSLHAGALAMTMAAIAIVGAVAPGILVSSLTPYQRETIASLRQVAALGETGMRSINCSRWQRLQTAAMFLKNKCLEPKFANAKVVLLIGDSHSAS